MSSIDDPRDSLPRSERHGLIQKIDDLERDWRGGLPTTPMPLEATPPAEASAPAAASLADAAAADTAPMGDFADEAALLFAQARWNECEACLTRAALDTSDARRSAARQLLLLLHRSRGDLAKAASLVVDIFLAAGPGQAGNPLDQAICWTSPAVLDGASLQALCGLLQSHVPVIADWRELQAMTPDAADPLRRALLRLDTHTALVAHAGLPGLYRLTRSHYRNDASPSARPAGAAFLALLQHLAMADSYLRHSLEFRRRFDQAPPEWTAGPRRSADLEVLLAHFPGPTPAAPRPDRPWHDALAGELTGAGHPELIRLARHCRAARDGVRVDCSSLVRVDFVAAGELLDLHLALRGQGKALVLLHTHPLIRLFLAPMRFTLDET